MPEQVNELLETVFNLSQSEVDELRSEALEKAKNTRHTWRQKGHWLVCKSCENPHASWLGRDKIMVGEKEDGTPIIVDRDKT